MCNKQQVKTINKENKKDILYHRIQVRKAIDVGVSPNNNQDDYLHLLRKPNKEDLAKRKKYM